MAHGGKRPGAGAKKGAKLKWKRGDLPDLFGDRCMDIIAEALDSDNPSERKWMFHEILPYVFSRKPQLSEISGRNGEPIEFIEARRTVEGRLARLASNGATSVSGLPQSP